MLRFGRALMLFLGVINLGFALWVVIDPLPVANALALSPAGPAAAAELRAMYGGLIGGFGILNLIGGLREKRLCAALWVSGWSFLGIGSVRLLSCLFLELSGAQLIYAVFELCCAFLSLYLLSQLERAEELGSLSSTLLPNKKRASKL